jgi:hypothetical protein
MPKTRPRVLYTTRLFDEILVAFHGACDQRDNEVASELIRVLDFVANRKPPLSDPNIRRIREGLVAAHERLWDIQRPSVH